MTNYLKSLWDLIAAFWRDLTSRYLLIFSCPIVLIVILVWQYRLVPAEIIVYQNFGFDPLRFLAAIIGLNTLLALFSHPREKEIAHLMLIGNIIISVLVLTLEIFYLSL